jgi:Cd2+/Zn2+-exporting ATPase
MTKKQKINLTRILLAAAMLVGFHFMPVSGLPRLFIYLIPYLIVGWDVIAGAVHGIVNRQPFDESLLMAVATIGAIGLALYDKTDYTEAIAVMLFYQIGELFESYAVNKSRRNISALMDIRPDYANIENEDGIIEAVDPDEIEIGSIIIVKPGEKVPIDGIVEEGESRINLAALTGESLPKKVKPGDEILSGCINQSGLLKIKTTHEFGESTASKILELVENASSRKSRSEDFIKKFARIYTPTVVFAAIALALLPPLVRILILQTSPAWGIWIYRALTFLVISCPCALVISIPLSFFAALGGAGKAGILIKGSNFIESLSKTDTVVLDKTGTLTKGVFEVVAVHPEEMDERELLHIAAHVERYSTHPIALSLLRAYKDENDDCSVEDVEEIAGMGVKATVNGEEVHVGNSDLMDKIGASWHPCHKEGTIIHVAKNSKYEGHIVISDVIKSNAKEAIGELRKTGVKNIVMLTGDSKKVADRVAEEVGIDKLYSELLPKDKVDRVEDLLEGNKTGGSLIFVGDGINDAPVLARADIGMAMGAVGSDAAIEAADVVLMDDNPMKISQAIHIAKKCFRIVKQNISLAIGIKLICLVLGALGIVGMWAAVFADVGVMIICVLNSIRALRAGKA